MAGLVMYLVHMRALLEELERLRESFHRGSDVSVAIVRIEARLWKFYGDTAVPANPFGDEEDAQVTALAELGTVLADFKAWTGGPGPKEAKDQIEFYIEVNWQEGWSEEAKAWLRSAKV